MNFKFKSLLLFFCLAPVSFGSSDNPTNEQQPMASNDIVTEQAVKTAETTQEKSADAPALVEENVVDASTVSKEQPDIESVVADVNKLTSLLCKVISSNNNKFLGLTKEVIAKLKDLSFVTLPNGELLVCSTQKFNEELANKNQIDVNKVIEINKSLNSEYKIKCVQNLERQIQSAQN